jgi:hypothetical protein
VGVAELILLPLPEKTVVQAEAQERTIPLPRLVEQVLLGKVIMVELLPAIKIFMLVVVVALVQ